MKYIHKFHKFLSLIIDLLSEKKSPFLMVVPNFVFLTNTAIKMAMAIKLSTVLKASAFQP